MYNICFSLWLWFEWLSLASKCLKDIYFVYLDQHPHPTMDMSLSKLWEMVKYSAKSTRKQILPEYEVVPWLEFGILGGPVILSLQLGYQEMYFFPQKTICFLKERNLYCESLWVRMLWFGLKLYYGWFSSKLIKEHGLCLAHRWVPRV